MFAIGRNGQNLPRIYVAFANSYWKSFGVLCRLRKVRCAMTVKEKDIVLSPDHYFAALKLIEQLYKDGEIPAYMFRNILNEYGNVVDLSRFAIINKKEDGT